MLYFLTWDLRIRRSAEALSSLFDSSWRSIADANTPTKDSKDPILWVSCCFQRDSAQILKIRVTFLEILYTELCTCEQRKTQVKYNMFETTLNYNDDQGCSISTQFWYLLWGGSSDRHLRSHHTVSTPGEWNFQTPETVIKIKSDPEKSVKRSNTDS